MQSKAKTVAQYLKALPADRREAIEAVRKVILKNLPKGYEEGMQYGMIGYFVPLSRYPAGYHCDPTQPLPFAHLASQKNHMAVYMLSVYGEDADWFQAEWKKTGKKLNAGKSCVRFRKVEDLALDLIGKAIKRTPVKRFIAWYEAAIPESKRKKTTKKKKAAKKKTSKKKAAKKPTGKKKAAKKKPAAKKPAAKKPAAKKPAAKKKASTRRKS